MDHTRTGCDCARPGCSPAERRRPAGPGACSSVDQLVDVLWPDENLVGNSGRNRLYTAVRELRRRGLADVLQSSREGYRLDPSVPLVEVA